MSVTISADNYPVLAAATGVSGKRNVIYLNYGASATSASPVWTLLGGVTSHTLTISAEVATAQTKSTGLWAAGSITGKTAELSADIMLQRDDVAQMAIDEFMKNDDITAAKHALQVAVVDLDTKEGLKLDIVPSSWELSASSGDMLQYSLSATVVGAPVKITNFTAA